MEYLNIGLVYFFEYLITISFCNRVMEKKYKYLHILALTLPFYALGFVIYFLFENTLLNTVISFFMYFFTIFIGYKEKLYKKIIYTVYLSIISYTSETIFISIFYSKYQPITKEDSLTAFQQLLVVISAKLIHFILVQLLALIINRKDFSGNNKLLPLFIYPAISLAFTIQFMSLTAKYNYTRSETSMFLLISGIDAIMCIAIFMYYGLIDEKDRKLKELEKEQQLAELNNAYMQVLEHQNNELQMVFHDTKHHFMALDNMDDADEMKAYIHKIIPAMESNNNVSISSNKMLNLLLNKYIVICKSKGIKFTYDVKTVSLDYIDDAELSILICNILDNAIESAEQSKDKTISMSIKHINSMDLLSVENSCDIEPKHKNGKLITSKANAQNHGYGTKIIEKHSRMNNGQMEWSYDKDEHIFCLSILFQR